MNLFSDEGRKHVCSKMELMPLEHLMQISTPDYNSFVLSNLKSTSRNDSWSIHVFEKNLLQYEHRTICAHISPSLSRRMFIARLHTPNAHISATRSNDRNTQRLIKLSVCGCTMAVAAAIINSTQCSSYITIVNISLFGIFNWLWNHSNEGAMRI